MITTNISNKSEIDTSIIAATMERTNERLSGLHEAITVLESKLSPVMGPCSMAGETLRKEDECAASPLKRELESQQGMIISAEERIRGILSKLEI